LAALILVSLGVLLALWIHGVANGFVPSLNTPMEVVAKNLRGHPVVELSQSVPVDLAKASKGEVADIEDRKPIEAIEPGVQRTQLLRLDRSGSTGDGSHGTNDSLDVLFDWPTVWSAQSAQVGAVVLKLGTSKYSLSKGRDGKVIVQNLTTTLDSSLALRLDVRDPQLGLPADLLAKLTPTMTSAAYFVPAAEVLKRIKEATDLSRKEARGRYPAGFTLTTRLKWEEGLVFEVLSVTPNGGEPQACYSRVVLSSSKGLAMR
jgi:hypothetical protein